jgi:hypothetical protein
MWTVRVKRHADSDRVDVQVADKTAMCRAGNVGCAFTRALEWAKTGRTVDHDGCVVGESSLPTWEGDDE